MGERFYPPRVAPAAELPRFPFYLPKLLGNILAMIPERAYREPVVLAPGPPRMAFITGRDAVKEILNSKDRQFPKGRLQNDVLAPLFGQAMILSEGKEWRWQRGVAAPLFRHEEILRYGPVMTDVAEGIIESWRRAPAGTVHDIQQDMLHASFEVISQTMLVGGAPELISQVEQSHSQYFSAVNWRIAYRLLGLPEWLPRPGSRTMLAHEKRLRGLVQSIVEARSRAAWGGADLLSRLIRSTDPETGQAMSDELIIGNMAAFLVAGYDTTALTLTWTLFLIAHSPEWETRIVQEVDRVAGSGPVTSDHVPQLHVVQQVLNESMRLYPAAVILVRDILQDTELEGVRIPAGTVGLVPIYAIHHHHENWADPGLFDPDRFGPQNPKPSRYKFMPFGAGPRICIGAAFAVTEAVILIASFVRAARFSPGPDFDPRPLGQMLLRPKRKMRMAVTMR